MVDTQPSLPDILVGVVPRGGPGVAWGWLVGILPVLPDELGFESSKPMAGKAVLFLFLSLALALPHGVLGDVVAAGSALPAGSVLSVGGEENAPAAVGPGGTRLSSATNASETGGSPPAETSLGGSISSFMQASGADASQTVDTEMFEARFNHSTRSERTALVQERIAELERRIERIEARQAALRTDIENGTVTPAERARAARLAARARGLRQAIASTEAATTRADISVDGAELETLRRTARALSGSDVSRVATGLNASGDPGSPEIAPDNGVGSQGQHDRRSGNDQNSRGTERN